LKIKDLKIDNSWTLFLDRDGVINRKLENTYVCNWGQFEFLPGVTEGLRILADIFKRIIIVTNQEGIGKGLMTERDLEDIHKRMLKEIENKKGRIDKIYYCPYKEENKSNLRKPETGMALLAGKDFPEIIFEKTIMVGDDIRDMEFGRKLNMINVLISDDKNTINDFKEFYTFNFESLLKFSQAIEK
jgi:D-glycero-D-manno-heptose 1,7-bisphosphate phosphatase